VDALAALADEYPAGRQDCVTVLCGYLRRPAIQAGDLEVRQGIVTLIRDRLQPGATPSWSTSDVDLSGSVLVDVSFEGALFGGERTSFERVTFTGEWTSFDGVTFDAEWTSFDGATFGSFDTSFDGVTFSRRRASFDGATFSGVDTSFDHATFASRQTSFDGACFGSLDSWFDEAVFVSERTSFDQAVVHGTVSFGPETYLPAAAFRLDTVAVQAPGSIQFLRLGVDAGA